MTKIDLAYPPFRMKYSEAARYCGMSASAFQLALKENQLPKGHNARGGRFWLRYDLEKAMVDQVGAITIEESNHDFSEAI